MEKEQWEIDMELRDKHVAEGLVACDMFCGAKESPYTFEEYKTAWLHWKSHNYMHGCSHSR